MASGKQASHPHSHGKLYVVATPIGNLEDLSLRALRILKEVSIIACEDTRQTLKLLNKYGLKKSLLSYYHPKEQQKIPPIMKNLKEGKDVALISDSGTPGISDPGYPLIKEAIEQGIQIIPLPGPSALTAALSASGLPTHKVLFLGFPSPKKGKMKKILSSLREEDSTLVFYLPARKLHTFLNLIKDCLGNRQVVIAREITKIHEEFIRGTSEILLEQIKDIKIKGEMTILIQGAEKKK
ncbi:MAG: 16S rRNA (cytidine(1402)-2'-O)-methyltransferase [Candidatus Aminicenantaceae bacterium]